MKRNPWRTTGSRTVYQNPWLRVREDQVVQPSGGSGIYGVVEIRPSVGILALNANHELAIVGQWRYALARYSYEIVRGGSDEGETDMLAAARRELREETGFEARSWQALGSVDVCNGVTTDVQHLFIAQDLSYIGADQDPFEEISTEWLPFARAVDMVMTGAITEVCSVAAILKYNAGR